jgi:hypothetical protein
MYDTDFLLFSSVFLLEGRWVVTPTSFRTVNFNTMHSVPEKIKLNENMEQCPTWMQYGGKNAALSHEFKPFLQEPGAENCE